MSPFFLDKTCWWAVSSLSRIADGLLCTGLLLTSQLLPFACQGLSCPSFKSYREKPKWKCKLHNLIDFQFFFTRNFLFFHEKVSSDVKLPVAPHRFFPSIFCISGFQQARLFQALQKMWNQLALFFPTFFLPSATIFKAGLLADKRSLAFLLFARQFALRGGLLALTFEKKTVKKF